MIQRIQTVFLLLAAGSFCLLYLIPFAGTAESVTPYFEDTVFDIRDHILILSLAIAGAVIPLVAVFLFRNRPRQVALAYIAMVIALLLPLTTVLLFLSSAKSLPESTEVQEGFGILLPLVALVLLILAVRFIRKDEKLVRSMDRLR